MLARVMVGWGLGVWNNVGIEQSLIFLLAHYLYFQILYKLMDNMLEESGESISPRQSAYEENEVVWAKIQGFPWWPAYVVFLRLRSELYKLIVARSKFIRCFSSETTHSTVFQQSLLSSQINFLKIRKFQPFFSTFAKNTRTNYKLKQALLLAQQQLSQNQESITYFSALKDGKPGRKSSKSHKTIVHHQNNGHFNQQSKSQPRVRRGRPKKQKPVRILRNPVILQSQGLPLEIVDQRIENASNQNDARDTLQAKNNEHKSEGGTMICASSEARGKSELQKLTQLVSKRLYKQAYQYLSSMTINADNVIQILDRQIMGHLANQLGFRQLYKLRELLQNALLQKYFKHSQGSSCDLEELKYGSVRGRVVRKLLIILRKTLKRELQHEEYSHTDMRRLVVEWESSVRLRFADGSEYMREIVNICNQIDNFALKVLSDVKRTLISNPHCIPDR